MNLPPGERDSPGSQLYIYRLLQLATAREAPGSSPGQLSYSGVRALATSLGVTSNNQLIALFRDLGLGGLKIDIGHERLLVTLTPASAASKGQRSGFSDCELERGMIDGALELVTGVPVTTVETRCRTRGDDVCCFEAIMDRFSGEPRFVPGSAAGMERFIVAGGITTGRPGAGHGGSGPAPGSLRAWFMDLAARELARARRHGRQLTVMYVDLDDLGQINSAHGRTAGDQVIKAVGAALGRSCRTEDFIWHQGEDEFAIVLTETGSNGADIVARRLSLQVLSAAEYVDVAAKISASIGFSTFPGHAEDVIGLFKSARSAVYLAKSLGKGRSQKAQQLQSTEREKDAGYGGPASKASESGTDNSEPAGRGRSRTSAKAEPIEPGTRGEPVASLVIATDSPLLMTGMRQVFSASDGFEIVSEIADPRRLPSVVADLRPDLIFCDLDMATEDDFAVLKLLRDQNLPCKFSVFAADIDQDVIKLAADFSVDGVILQESAASEILAIMRSVYQGKTVLPGEVQEAMSELSKNRRLLEELSEREVEVLKLVAEGKSNSQISKDLFITVNTVRFHLANIYQKLSVSNRTEAANYYLRQNLTPDGQTRLL
ncbi:MAG: diguanylate cyclase [Thermoleophilia bacterium]